jgi:hypothetical protein
VKRALALLAVPVLLAGCAARTLPTATGSPLPAPVKSSGSPTPSPTPKPTCPPDGVRLEMGTGDAASGLRILGIVLVNCGKATYRLDGYPEVRPLDDEHATMDVKVLRGVHEITDGVPEWDRPPKPVVLAPGHQAMAILAWRNLYTDIRHPPVTVPYLEVAPASGKPAQVLAVKNPLDLGSTGQFGVSPWQPDEPSPPAKSATAKPTRSGTASPAGSATATTKPPLV